MVVTTVLYCTLLCHIVLYCTLLYSAVLCCNVLILMVTLLHSKQRLCCCTGKKYSCVAGGQQYEQLREKKSWRRAPGGRKDCHRKHSVATKDAMVRDGQPSSCQSVKPVCQGVSIRLDQFSPIPGRNASAAVWKPPFLFLFPLLSCYCGVFGRTFGQIREPCHFIAAHLNEHNKQKHSTGKYGC